MDKPPYSFRSLTHFSVYNVEEKLGHVIKLTLNIESKIDGKHTLILFDLRPPLNRPDDLIDIKALSAAEIDSMYAFVQSSESCTATRCRIEIIKKDNNNIIIPCKKIDGLPYREESVP